MRNSVKRWIGALLAACLVMALLPTAALATDTGKAIQRVSNDSADNIGGGQADNVYFGIFRAATEAAAITQTPSSGGCCPTRAGSCSCFPTRTLKCSSITRSRKT